MTKQTTFVTMLNECSIGEGTNIWQFVVVMKGAIIGSDCNICANSLIEGNVKIGNRVTVKSGVSLWDGIIVENDVFIARSVKIRRPDIRVICAGSKKVTVTVGVK